jgi:tripartite-type tricarboxylate transporter receptor subunit TctC
MDMQRTAFALIAALALTLTDVGPAAAQSYPEKPIKLIVPFPPGGPTDYVARLAAQSIATHLGPAVIENRPGAGGTVATKAFLNANPDGYSILYGTSGTLGIAPALYRNVDYDAVRSFAPIALVSRVPFVLGVAATVPVTTLRELIAYAKANPGKLNYGATIGTPPHLVGELFKVTTGVDIFYVPYKGAAQAMTDLLAGQMHMAVEGVSTLLPHIQSGKVRALAVTSPQRIPALPDVPTMHESGYGGFPPGSWSGVLAPAATAAAIVDKLNTAINKGLQSPEIRTNLIKLGADGPIGSPQDFAAFIAVEAPKWATLAKASSARIE